MDSPSFNDDLHNDSVVKYAVEVLRGESSTPPGDLLNRIVANLESAEATQTRPTAPARLRRFGRARRAAATFALMVLGSGVFGYLLTRSGSGIALGQAIEKARATKTMTYEVAVERRGTASTLRYRVMVSGARRREVDEQDGSITIRDEETGEAIRLFPGEKRAVLINPTSSRPASRPAGEPLDLAREFENIHAAMRAGAEKRLGRKQIDGRTCTGFRNTHDGVRTTIWVDEASLLPVQVEHVVPPLEDRPTLFSHIRFDVALDPSLFDLTPPPGYRVQNFTPIRVQLGTAPAPLLPGQENYQPPTEGDVIEHLRYVAAENGNVFPATESFMGHLPSVPPGRPADESERNAIAAAARRMLLAQRSTLYLASQKAGQVIYLGESTRLGDATKAVFAWDIPDKKQVRVIYGDLNVRSVDPSGQEFKAIVLEYQAQIAQREQSRGWLGIEPQDTESKQGCRVILVLPSSPAGKGGLREGDVITGVGDQSIRTEADWRAAIKHRKPGESIVLEIRRGTQVSRKDIVLGSAPATRQGAQR